MCFLCQSLDPSIEIYDGHGLTGPTAAPSGANGGTTEAALPVFTLDQVAYQLTHGYWQNGGGDWRAFDVQAGGEITVNIDALDAAGQTAALAALEAWTAVSGIQFTLTSGTADITFDDTESGAYAYSYVYTSWNEIDQSFVNVHPSWQGYGDYYYQTYIHEIGHALGLGHGGNYNGAADFGTDAHYANDSWQMSIMSYFAQWENPNVDASGMYLATPQMADILAIQNLYGTPDNVHTGNTVYGDNTNLTATGMDLAPGRAVAIFDSSGIDVIDLGSRGHDQRLSLEPESWSDIDGYAGNFAIARGAVIENAITGSGDDHITGNAASNDIQSGAGADTIKGGEGDDTIDGGAGVDVVVFEGASEGFALAWNGALTVTDIDLTDGGDDGTDTLLGVETLSFTDGAFGTVQDNGTTTLVRLYQTGSNLTAATLEIDVDDTHEWESIARDFTATGQWAKQTNTYDNGRVLEIFYSDGLRTSSTMTDSADVYAWDSYTDGYDASGARIYNGITWDGGKLVETHFDADGARTSSLVTDGGDVYGWHTIERVYDGAGVLTDQTNTYDDGRVQQIVYTGGARSAIHMTDAGDVASWASYSDFYDTATGARTARQMTFDDGRQVEIGFDGGRMVSHLLTDGADDFVWSSIARTWDAEGQLDSQTNTYDDGRVHEIDYADGVRSSSVLTDTQDAYAWTSATETYDASGALVERVTIWDDGSQDVVTYGDSPVV
ncbi:M10 family metallopeptidase C-terminal domain-containing protein [Mameliella sp. AT18]|uniref:M10 family metallopeptidase C-terminal domain-containing protein n=1 Tax=Mameliella sp. AT18 TaxID=3028385 RepID=UPI0008410761|nr:M10 family metallopeptidase C-terminal domain-containing protein [Mameliella sp. AT18]MDD9729228.1 M10 family metallopeptidase C-terminal domain-containing protein [Mameliella sp. AT18]ODM45490.1 hypothetical protein A9320_10745 [Ruegeria sp. PBVC088]